MNYGQKELPFPKTKPAKDSGMYWRYDADREQYHIDYWTGDRYVVAYWVVGDFEPRDGSVVELVSPHELLVALR